MSNIIYYSGTDSSISLNQSTASGLNYSYQEKTQSLNGQVKRIGPKLYFSYVKSKLTKIQQKNLKARLSKLQSLVKNADETGQKALYEETSRMLLVAVRESEATACGYDVYVDKRDINKFMSMVTEDAESTRNPIRFKKLEEFSRPIPSKVSKVIKSVQSKGIFDELWVLYLDYSGEEIKSNKEKIREKDPVLFGKFKYDDSKHYFITDWIDEHCDLTLSKFVDKLKESDQEYDVNKVEDITPAYLERIKIEMQAREDRLSSAQPGNFRDKMAEEDKAELKRLKEENEKLREKERFIDEDKEIAIERALKENWNKASNPEKPENYNQKPQPWWKGLFK